jgi:hypothetical protein
MRLPMRQAWLPALLAAAALAGACQSPTSTDTDTLDVDDFVDASVSPSPATAQASTDGKTYRVVRGNNQPDDILAYDWKTTVSVTVTLNSNAASDDVDLEFPTTILSATAKVEQASGGIVSPPTGGEAEHYESVLVSSTGNSFAAAGASQTMVFDIWYDLPSLRKEALVTFTITLKDDDGATFAKTVTTQVN